MPPGASTRLISTRTVSGSSRTQNRGHIHQVHRAGRDGEGLGGGVGLFTKTECIIEIFCLLLCYLPLGSPSLLSPQHFLMSCNSLSISAYCLRNRTSRRSAMPCYSFGNLLTAEVLAHDAPYSDHNRKNCEQADADVNGYQGSKIEIRCVCLITFSLPLI